MLQVIAGDICQALLSIISLKVVIVPQSINTGYAYRNKWLSLLFLFFLATVVKPRHKNQSKETRTPIACIRVGMFAKGEIKKNLYTRRDEERDASRHCSGPMCLSLSGFHVPVWIGQSLVQLCMPMVRNLPSKS